MILWDLVGIPGPTMVVQNTDNYHSHYIYELGIPLPVRSKRSDKTKKLLDAVTDYYKLILCSHKVIVDQMQLSKNALSERWATWGSGEDCGLFSLSELSDYIKFIPQKRVPKDINRDSRNCYLFNQGRYYAYDIVKDCGSENNLYGMVHVYLNQLNDDELKGQFPGEGVLSFSEVKDIVKSISSWVWDKRHNFSLLKSYGKNSGALGLDPMGSGWKYEDSRAEVKRRQSLGAEYCHRTQKEKTQYGIYLGVERCKERGLEITTKNVSELSGVSIWTVRRYYKLLEELST